MRGNKKVTIAKGKSWPLILLAVASGSWLHAAKQRYLSGMLDLNLQNLTTCHLTCCICDLSSCCFVGRGSFHLQRRLLSFLPCRWLQQTSCEQHYTGPFPPVLFLVALSNVIKSCYVINVANRLQVGVCWCCFVAFYYCYENVTWLFCWSWFLSRVEALQILRKGQKSGFPLS